MAVYRITRFAATDMDKVKETGESMRDMLKGLGAEFIDVVSYRNGKGVVIAKYADDATMEASAEGAKKAFAMLVEGGCH